MRKIPPLIALTSLMLISCSPSENVQGKEPTSADIYLGLLEKPEDWEKYENSLETRWNLGQVPMILEVNRFTRNHALQYDLYTFLDKKTGNSFGWDSKKWQNWIWSQKYKPSENYPHFKSQLYRHIDPHFEEYFANDRKSTIRLDEIVWGGVLQDGIPPLRNPKMLSPAKATYLGDNDIVFGIEVAGEARAYPKRILAWHEMFTDTIQGVPLAGVY